MDVKLEVVFQTDSLGQIGLNGELLYRSKEDMNIFKSVTKEAILLMGRKTYEGVPKPSNFLARGNEIVVLSQTMQNKDVLKEVSLVDSIDLAVNTIELLAQETGKDRVIVVGGSGLYSSSFLRSLAHELDVQSATAYVAYPTEEKGEVAGSTKIDLDDFYSMVKDSDTLYTGTDVVAFKVLLDLR